MSVNAQRYWWVNHKKTFRQEFAGGYLWSPKFSSSGAKNQFYSNMRLATLGDQVVSYADGRIRAIGVVTDTAVTAPKPTEFRATGYNWSEWGWLLPVEWRPARIEARPSNYLSHLLPALPEKYSPLNNKSGKGNQNAYLSEISGDLMSLVLQWTGGPENVRIASCNVANLLEQAEERESTAIRLDSSLSSSEIQALVLARKGQGRFREQVIAQHCSCIVTGISDTRILKASHIKPWRLCSTSTERLDPRNGLLLTPNMDQLFDRGLISFNDDGSIILSSTLSTRDTSAMGLSARTIARTPLREHFLYMAYHRSEILIP